MRAAWEQDPTESMLSLGLSKLLLLFYKDKILFPPPPPAAICENTTSSQAAAAGKQSSIPLYKASPTASASTYGDSRRPITPVQGNPSGIRQLAS